MLFAWLVRGVCVCVLSFSFSSFSLLFDSSTILLQHLKEREVDAVENFYIAFDSSLISFYSDCVLLGRENGAPTYHRSPRGNTLIIISPNVLLLPSDSRILYTLLFDNN